MLLILPLLFVLGLLKVFFLYNLLYLIKRLCLFKHSHTSKMSVLCKKKPQENIIIYITIHVSYVTKPFIGILKSKFGCLRSGISKLQPSSRCRTTHSMMPYKTLTLTDMTRHGGNCSSRTTRGP